jgi:predicted dehydrogenase
MSTLKIGIIGGGGITGAHLPYLAQNPEVELVALADPFPAAKATAEKYNIPNFFNDYKELLPLVDAVLICVPTFLHADIAVDALNAGKAVFCEKPLARTLEQAQVIEAAIEKSGKPFQVGFVRRFDEHWLAFRDAVQAKKIGRPVIWQDVAASAGPPAPWFYRDEQGGGPFLDATIHNIDFALYTFGPAKWVFCNGRTWHEGSTAIDTGTVTIHFESGDELLLAWSWGLPAGAHADGVFQILGEGGTITWPKNQDASSSQRHFVVNTGTSQEEVSYNVDSLGKGFSDQMDEFVQVALGRKTPRATINEGRESLRVALAIIESARTSQVVQI